MASHDTSTGVAPGEAARGRVPAYDGLLGGRPTTGTAPVQTRLRKGARRWAHRARVVEAMGLLTLGSALQKWVPMPKWSLLLGRPGAVPSQWVGSTVSALPVRAESAAERATAVAVRSAATRLPWHSSCLAEATAAQLMLRQTRRGGVVVIGLRASESGPWDAHAWLLGARGALTGGPAARGFTATTVFEVPGGLRAEDVDLAPAL